MVEAAQATDVVQTPPAVIQAADTKAAAANTVVTAPDAGVVAPIAAPVAAAEQSGAINPTAVTAAGDGNTVGSPSVATAEQSGAINPAAVNVTNPTVVAPENTTLATGGSTISQGNTATVDNSATLVNATTSNTAILQPATTIAAPVVAEGATTGAVVGDGGIHFHCSPTVTNVVSPTATSGTNDGVATAVPGADGAPTAVVSNIAEATGTAPGAFTALVGQNPPTLPQPKSLAPDAVAAALAAARQPGAVPGAYKA